MLKQKIKLKRLQPKYWKIKHRLILAGICMTLLTALIPFNLQTKFFSLSSMASAYSGLILFSIFILIISSMWLTLIPDISELLRAIKEFQNGNFDYKIKTNGHTETAELGRAFSEMAISLKEQNEKLKELNRLKTDFVSTVSHELRTPLTAIKGSLGLILGGVTGPISPEVTRMLKITQKNTDRLIRLINDILDVAKIEAGAIQMRYDKYSIVEVIDYVVAAMKDFAKSSGVQLVWSPPEESALVVIDRDKMEQVLTNLLSNAVKFTAEGGTVTILCHYFEDQIRIEIIDTGQGIPEEFLDRIFQKFQQAESSAFKAKEGTGLGLTIVKALVEEHGGQVFVESTPNQGSKFSFTIPWNGAEFVEKIPTHQKAA